MNPELFKALKRLNGGRDPKISNPGVPGTFSVEVVDGKTRLHAAGEQYGICCVECGETRHRLYVHHMYGVKHYIPGFNQPDTELLCLAYCQNEGKRIRLEGYLKGFYEPKNLRTAETIEALNGTLVTAKRSCPPLGTCIPLQDLPDDHPAVVYLDKRNFSAAYLGQACGALVMESHPDAMIERMARGRIIFPFYVDGELLTWQGRSPYDLEKGKKWPPKWWFPGGTKKVPWNVDEAKKFEVVIICEGILSAANAGPAAVAIGGKSITTEGLKVITERWKKAVVMLDPDIGLNRAEGEMDYQERLIGTLRGTHMEVEGIQWIPGDLRDPGDIGFLGCAEALKRSVPHWLDLLPYARI